MTGRGRSSRTALVKTEPPNSKPRYRRGGCCRCDGGRLVHCSPNEFILRTVRSLHPPLRVLAGWRAPVEFRTSLGSPRSSQRQPHLGDLLGQRNRGRDFPSLRLESERGLL